MIVSEVETKSCHQKLRNRDHIASKRTKSYQNVSIRFTSYQNLKFQRDPTISYEGTIVAFVTDSGNAALASNVHAY